MPISERRWSVIQGTAVNCTRWVSSCRQTQSRKSCGSASSSRSACTMFGATSSSRPCSPGASWNGSNWPEHLGAEEAEHRAELDAGDPRPDRLGQRRRARPSSPAACRSAARSRSRSRRRWPGSSPGRSTTSTGAVRSLGDQPGELADQRRRALRSRAQLLRRPRWPRCG